MIDVITILISIFGLIAVYINLILKYRKEHKIEFIIEKFYEPTKKPVDSDWAIRILHPNKPIEKCSVLYDGDLIPWSDKELPYYEKRFVVMGGGNVRVPKIKQNEDAEIKIQNNKKTLKKVKFKDLLISQ